MTRSVIEEAAERGNAVILGRGAAFILGRSAGHAPRPASCLARRARFATCRRASTRCRPRRVRTSQSLRELCQSIDSARADYVRAIFDADWLDVRNYDLSVDIGRLGVDRTVDLIAAAATGNHAR